MATKPTKKISDMTSVEILNRDMNLAAWGNKLGRGGKKDLASSIRCKNDPVRLARLAVVRTPTQFGGSQMRQCTAFSKKRGDRCPNPAVRGFDCCRVHADGAQIKAMRDRRRAEGRPVERAEVLARRNLKDLLKRQRIPYELMREPIFQAAMRLVAPTWFGVPRGERRKFDQKTIREAALLAREMVLAWFTGTESGDWRPWHEAVGKVHALALYIPPRGLDY